MHAEPAPRRPASPGRAAIWILAASLAVWAVCDAAFLGVAVAGRPACAGRQSLPAAEAAGKGPGQVAEALLERRLASYEWPYLCGGYGRWISRYSVVSRAAPYRAEAAGEGYLAFAAYGTPPLPLAGAGFYDGSGAGVASFYFVPVLAAGRYTVIEWKAEPE